MAKVPKKSKYDEILARAREDKAKKAAAEAEEAARKASEATPSDKLNELLAEAIAVAEEVAAATKEAPPVDEPASPDSPYATKKQEEAAKKTMQEVLHPGSRKAYNIWFDTTTRYYLMDVIEYDGINVLSVKTERLTLSQAVAMAKVQKIFTEKLILRKKGV